MWRIKARESVANAAWTLEESQIPATVSWEIGRGPPISSVPNSYIEAAFSPLPFSLLLTKRSMSAMV